MTRVVAVDTEDVRIAVSRERVRRVAEHVLRAERVRDALVSITFVTNRRIAALNARHLGHRGPTDVREELLRLVVHGVLHVLGHDHPEDDARYRSPMWQRQERLLRAALTAA
jgi:probable rRNA maturation factor